MSVQTTQPSPSDRATPDLRRRWPLWKPLLVSFLIYQVLFVAGYVLSYGVAYNFD